MGRARRARRIAATAAFGGGGVAGLGVASVGLLLAQAQLARRAIGKPFEGRRPDSAGRYGDGAGEPIRLGMVGDSTAVGLGVDHPSQTPGAVMAVGLAALSGRPVEVFECANIGATSRRLEEQVTRLLEQAAALDGGETRPGGLPPVDVAVILVGANDVTHRLTPTASVRLLGEAVRRLRDAGVSVVVGTCPDLGSIEPIRPPLRYLAQRWSRQLAAAQTIAAVEAGARTVSLGALIGPDFRARRGEMFSADRFHPSAAGYARLAAVLLPSLLAALELEVGPPQRPDLRAGEGVDDVAHAAARAAAHAGTEVSGAEVDGATRGPRGRWAVLVRRVQPALPQLPNLPTLPNLPALPNLPIQLPSSIGGHGPED